MESSLTSCLFRTKFLNVFINFPFSDRFEVEIIQKSMFGFDLLYTWVGFVILSFCIYAYVLGNIYVKCVEFLNNLILV